jgi:hypothetical protein
VVEIKKIIVSFTRVPVSTMDDPLGALKYLSTIPLGHPLLDELEL